MSYDKRTVRAWVLYDFANSIYPAVVTTAVFPIFYRSTIVGGKGDWGNSGGAGRWPHRR